MLFQFVKNGDGLPSSITPSSGSVSINTKKIRGMVRLIHIEMNTAGTTWDLAITDRYGHIVRQYTEEEGTRNDPEPLPVDGIYTLAFLNVSVDEAIKVLMVMEEYNR